MPLPASKSAIDRAGAQVRARALGEEIDPDDLADSLELVKRFRAAHSYPLANVAAGLRHHASRASGGEWFDLGQRLKQIGTIANKLARMPRTNLARLQDIGGCRATLLDQETVDRTIDALRRRARRGSAWDIVKVDDYVDGRAREDGYRAKHVVVRKHDVLIEIQFRTVAQHGWAQLVEDLDKALGLGIKLGRAPGWAVAAVAAASEDMRQYERGIVDRPTLVQALNASLAPLLDRSGGEIR